MRSTSKPGWFLDPWQPAQLRWWAGTEWTSDTAPLGSPPSAPDGAVPRHQQPSWWAFGVALLLVVLLGVHAWRMPSTGADSLTAPALASRGSDPQTIPGRTFAKRVVVPRLQSRQLRPARTAMRERGIELVVVQRLPSPAEKGSILAQRTEPGTRVDPGTVVHVVVAAPSQP